MKNSSVIRKILYALITILAVIIFNYFLFRVLPGDPISMIMRNPESVGGFHRSHPRFLRAGSALVQSICSVSEGLFTGDFGTSLSTKHLSWKLSVPRFCSSTVVMLGLAEIVAIIIGIFLGIGMEERLKAGCGHLSFSLITYSMPTFWLGMIMVVIFAVNLQMAAHQRHDYRRHGLFLEHGDDRRHGSPFDSSRHHHEYPFDRRICATMRNTLIDVLSEDYITTARAKGFREKYVLRKTRNAQRHAANGDDYRHQSGAGHRRCSTDRDDLLPGRESAT